MPLVFAIAALVGSVLLLGDKDSRMWGFIGIVAAGIAVATALGVISLSIAGISISLILGIALAVAGGIALTKVSSKMRIIAATIVAAVGTLTALAALGIA
jgi:hypothetical protein